MIAADQNGTILAEAGSPAFPRFYFGEVLFEICHSQQLIRRAFQT